MLSIFSPVEVEEPHLDVTMTDDYDDFEKNKRMVMVVNVIY